MAFTGTAADGKAYAMVAGEPRWSSSLGVMDVLSTFTIHNTSVGSGNNLALTADGTGQGFIVASDVLGRVHIGGLAATTADGLRIRQDPGKMWIETLANAKNMAFNLRNTGAFSWLHNYSTIMQLSATAFDSKVPGTFAITNPLTNTVLEALAVNIGSSGGPGAAGLGGGFTFKAENSASGFSTQAFWETYWLDPTPATATATTKMRLVSNAGFADGNNLFVLWGDGAGSGRIGMGTAFPTEKLDVRGGARIDGDIDHNGTNAGFYSVAPVARPAAFTQTYATATRTHAALTAATLGDFTGEVPDLVIEPVSPRSNKFWGFNSPSGTTGVFYFGGFYKWHSASFTPNAGAGTNIGTVNSSYAAHAVIILGNASANMLVRVTGTSINDNGTRTVADFEDIDTTGGARHTYFETAKKWIGQINYTLQGLTVPVVINAGFAKYWDFGNTDFNVVGCEATWLGGANDAAADIELLYHSATGWTYGAGGTPTTPTPLASMATDHVTEGDVKNNENGAWKRVNLATAVAGSASEGVLFRVTTSANRAFEHGTLQVDVTGSGAANRNFSDLTAQVNKLLADLTNTKQVLNQTIDDHQANGLLQ